MTDAGLYVHIPFCEKKCSYCNFYSKRETADGIDAYINALKDEISLVAKKHDGYRIKTIYLGGGTPSILSDKQIASVLETVYASFPVYSSETTIEVNPNSDRLLPFYKTLGFDRISVGVQSTDDSVLRTLGRMHTVEQGIATLKKAADTYENVSADLILGVSSGQDVARDVERVSPYVKHISAYILTLEEKTALYRLVQQKKVSVATDEELAQQYETLYNVAGSKGFMRYETSNFAVKGYASKHNSAYWDLTPYFGVGTSAHSYVGGTRYYNVSDVKAYCEGAHSGYDRQILERAPDVNEDRMEFAMLSLRTEQGIDLDLYRRKFDSDFLSDYKKGIKKAEKYVRNVDGYFRILPQYFLVQNTVIGDILL